jgi:hypothetical protein
MQRYRADVSKRQNDSAVVWYASWFGGPTLSHINNCRIDGIEGDMRRAVYVTGEADTWFSIPAVTRIMGCRVTGYVTSDDNRNYVFHATYY